MSLLDEAATTFQVGVRKTAPVRSGKIDEFPAVPAERLALAEVATLDLMRRAGTNSEEVKPLSNSPIEPLKVALTAPVEEAFGNETILLEWVARATERGYVAPPNALPGLVQRLERLGPAILPVLGERGRWLADVMGVRTPKNLESPPDDRAITEWETLDWKERGDAILALQHGLSPDDEPVLLRGLQDRRKEVRDIAARLALLLPNSQPSQEIRQLAAPILSVKRSLLKTSLVITLPNAETLPKWLPRGAWAGVGANASALADIVAHVPPSFFTNSTGLALPELYEKIQKSDFSKALQEGLEEAALRFDDQVWIDILFNSAIPVRADLWRRASPNVFDAAAKRWLGSGEKEAHRLLLQIGSRPGTLSREVSQAILDSARSATAPYPYSLLGHKLHLSVLPAVREPWAENSIPEKVRESWYPALELRARLLKSLE